MKKIFLSLIITCAVFGSVTAQTKTETQIETKTMTKAEKQAAKEKKEADLIAAFETAGLTADEQSKFRACMDASNEKAKPIKADESLSAEDKKAKLDVIYHERNDEIKTILGKEKYKAFKDAQKAQKEASMQ